MTDRQWQKLKAVVNGNVVKPIPVAFVIDSPWLPPWAGISTLDYFTSEQLWFEANLKAVSEFPDVIFLPGFWAEFGMCTEPSAFGCKCSWQQDDHPFPHKIITDLSQIDTLEKPNCEKDGMLPFIIKRLEHNQARITEQGHSIKFAVSRGPLNIASFLCGTTEFLTAIRTEPDSARKLLGLVTEFIIDWLRLQKNSLASIDGIFILDDIVGFLGPDDFQTFAKPSLARIFQSLDITIKFFHNDAPGLVCAPHLPDIGVNLFNFSYNHCLEEMKKLTGNRVALVGNIAPREVLVDGSPQQVVEAVSAAVKGLADKTRTVLSAGGGLPGGVPTQNIQAFISAASKL